MSNDLRTKGIILRHTNYGEADRILTIITKDGIIPQYDVSTLTFE